MIDLHTGLPGNGKTLYTLSRVEKRRVAENRTVYYHGINDLKLEWLPMPDPQKWFELPAGAILVFDEVQRVWPKRATGAPVPLSEQKFETHRHQGFDVYFITQDPGFIDSHLRKLCNTHRHLMRKFGSKWVTVHQFEGVRDNVSKSRKDSIESQWVDDVSMYGKYKSAEVITQKIRVPFKVWLIGLLPVFIIGMAYYFYQRRLAEQPPPKPAAVSSQTASAAAPAPAPQAQKRTYDLAAFTPRLEGLPHTAPRYDELTAPVRVPVVAGCIWSETSQRGHCVTQQGTVVSPPPQFIKQFVARGMFEDFERGPALGQQFVKSGPDEGKPLTRSLPDTRQQIK